MAVYPCNLRNMGLVKTDHSHEEGELLGACIHRRQIHKCAATMDDYDYCSVDEKHCNFHVGMSVVGLLHRHSDVCHHSSSASQEPDLGYGGGRLVLISTVRLILSNLVRRINRT